MAMRAVSGSVLWDGPELSAELFCDQCDADFGEVDGLHHVILRSRWVGRCSGRGVIGQWTLVAGGDVLDNRGTDLEEYVAR